MLNFFGHVIRRDNFEKTIMQGKFERERNRSRPPICYINQIKILVQMSVVDNIRYTENREFWRNLLILNNNININNICMKVITFKTRQQSRRRKIILTWIIKNICAKYSSNSYGPSIGLIANRKRRMCKGMITFLHGHRVIFVICFHIDYTL